MNSPEKPKQPQAKAQERRMTERALYRDPTYRSPDDELRHSRLEGEYERRLVAQAEKAAERAAAKRRLAREALPRPIPAQTAGEPTVAPVARNRA